MGPPRSCVSACEMSLGEVRVDITVKGKRGQKLRVTERGTMYYVQLKGNNQMYVIYK